MSVKFISRLIFVSSLIALIDTCERKQLLKFYLAVVEVVSYLKQVFHLLCDKCASPAEELLYLSLIL